jgi:hypothetical protein
MKILLKIRPSLQEVPKELKQKVMDDINTVKFIIEVTSLFHQTMPRQSKVCLRQKSKNNNDTNQ